jgi:F0F1-type ATP synthase assembly protein I
MEYAIQLLIPILLGFLLGVWLHNQFGLSPVWSVIFAILGMFGGIGILYKRYLLAHPYRDPKTFKNLREYHDDDEQDV